MRFLRSLGLGAVGLASLAAAEDLLMHEDLKYVEYDKAIDLGYTVKLVNDADWAALTTADFAKYKAIVFGDPDCVYDSSPIAFAEKSTSVWGPAVSGNIVVIGTDPSFHSYAGQDGADTLIENSLQFAAAGNGTTGLYFALSCYYHYSDTAAVPALSYFGSFTVRGNLNCYNEAHIVATSPAMTSLTDGSLSDWECSVHEAFSDYPTSGAGGFQALAIAKDIMGVGSRSFGDGTSGLPYVISRGATPAACGNGLYQPQFNEECDDGAKNGTPGDLCDVSCKCIYGVLDATAGTCKSAPVSSSSSSSSSTSWPTTTTAPPPPCNTIVGVEIIEVIIEVEECPEGATTTVTVTSTSTVQRPIYPTPVSGLPCYPCAVGTPSAGAFMTVSYTSCSGEPSPTITYQMCSTCAASTASDSVPGYTPGTCASCTAFVSERPHVHDTTTQTPVATGTAWPYGGSNYTLTTVPAAYWPTTTAVNAYSTAAAVRNAAGVGAGLLGGLIALAAL